MCDIDIKLLQSILGKNRFISELGLLERDTSLHVALDLLPNNNVQEGEKREITRRQPDKAAINSRPA